MALFEHTRRKTNNKSNKKEIAEDNPKSYEGKEHVKYKNPGFSKHEVDLPEDEPHMRSNVSKNEMHEMEDNFHMKTPEQTKHELAKNIKRARMKMDAPDQEEPAKLRGNMVTNTPMEGVEDEDGEEEMGPNHMQGSGENKDEDDEDNLPKEQRKKMIVSIVKRKMKK